MPVRRRAGRSRLRRLPVRSRRGHYGVGMIPTRWLRRAQLVIGVLALLIVVTALVPPRSLGTMWSGLALMVLILGVFEVFIRANRRLD
jgi:ABC-type multidrug transport system permease subunit